MFLIESEAPILDNVNRKGDAMFQILHNYTKEIVSISCVIFAFVLTQYFRPRAKLIYGARDETSLLVEEPLKDAEGNQIAARQILHTTSISLTNVGKETAKNVEITFNWKPQYLNVWPARHFEERTSQHDRHTIYLESMAPKEVFGIDIFSINQRIPEITAVRSDECEGKKVEMEPMVVQPKWLLSSIWILLIIGFISVVYAFLSAVQFLFFR